LKAGRVAWSIVGMLSLSDAFGQTIVWTDANARRIQGRDVNGGEIQTLVQIDPPNVPSQVHYDPIAAKLYYYLYATPSTFQRANLDGSEPENIPTPSVGNFTLNVESRKLYWISEFSHNVLYRSELDGLGVESHTYPSCCVLTLEALGDDLFFGAGGGMFKGIWRADADGSNEQYLHLSGQPFDMAHDPVENKLYLATIEGIYRLNPDGTGFQKIGDTGSAPLIVVDSRARKVYWGGFGRIRRSNLDGSNMEDFVTPSDAGNPNLDIRGLTIVYSDPVTGACCDADPFMPCTDDRRLSQCECVSCTWRPFRTCAEIECAVNPIPTASAWGLIVLALLLMIAAKIAFGRPVALSRVTHGG